MAATGNYIDEDDVSNWASGTTEAQKQTIIDRVEERIEKFTRDLFYSKAYVAYHNGNGSDFLDLGLAYKILTITEILIAGSALSTDWWTYDGTAVYLNPESATGGADDQAELYLRTKYKRSLFPEGTRNIKITGTVGWTSIPESIIQATIMMAMSENDASLFTKYSGFESERLGDYSYKLAKEGNTGNLLLLSGIQEVDDLIRPFIRKTPIMGAI